jgi:hypothetical protein
MNFAMPLWGCRERPPHPGGKRAVPTPVVLAKGLWAPAKRADAGPEALGQDHGTDGRTRGTRTKKV